MKIRVIVKIRCKTVRGNKREVIIRIVMIKVKRIIMVLIIIKKIEVKMINIK